MKHNKLFFLLLAVMLITVLSCEAPVSYTTIEWDLDSDNFYQFYTDDPANKGYIFSSGWDPTVSTFTSAVFEVKKNSGSALTAYGIVFCRQDTNNRYYLGIDTTGYYTIWKKKAGTNTTIKDWTFTSNLLTGYNAINKIEIRYSNPAFTIYFNNFSSDSFSDTDFICNGYGFHASVSSTSDNLPSVPVDVRCRLLSIDPSRAFYKVLLKNEADIFEQSKENQ